MKQICFILYFFIFVLPCLWGADDAVLNLWSGKWCDLAGQGKWQIAAKHGRVLAAGNGNIRFQIPALQADSTLDAYLIMHGKKQELCFYSPLILSRVSAEAFDLDLKCEKVLQSLGVSIKQKKKSNIAFASYIAESYSGKLLFVFTEKKDFPLKLGGEWTKTSLHRTKNSGCLSILYNAQEKLVDCNGECTYIQLEQDNRVVIVFSPDFNMENIENALLIKYIIENNIHNKGAAK